MAVRKIIKIDEEKCNGCGLCVPNCAEGAIQIINGKAKLVKDSYCDGLGACLGHCPQDALEIIEREADEFNEEEAMNYVNSLSRADKQKDLNRLNHNHAAGGCPGSRMMVLKDRESSEDNNGSMNVSGNDVEIRIKPQLSQWPVQLSLVPVNAPYFKDSDLLVTADCVPFSYPNYHLDLLKGKSVVVGCPKLDDLEFYIEKLTQIIQNNNLKSITVAFMEVPCCSGIVRAVDLALKRSGKDLPVNKVRIGINGSRG
ncbi:MAG: 4Fe-4S binding protein [Clostridiaceae bacterium]|nr:4Fe-4S binding protein [Clostridiaceae bacterium]